jgi:DNA-binding CsgD family transcriptional regulator
VTPDPQDTLDSLASRAAFRAVRVGFAVGGAVGGIAVLLAIVNPGPRPAERMLLALAMSAAWLVAFWRLEAVVAGLRRRPWVLPVIALASALPVALDGGYHSPLLIVSWPLPVVAAAVAPARVALLCGAATGAAYVLSVLGSAGSTAVLLSDAQRYETVASALNGLLAAGLSLVLVAAFQSVARDGAQHLVDVHGGASTARPALGDVIRGKRPVALLPARIASREPLSPAERRIVEQLAGGKTPKQIAFEAGVSLHTVRTQIKHAKRKTGARTIEELVAGLLQAAR